MSANIVQILLNRKKLLDTEPELKSTTLGRVASSLKKSSNIDYTRAVNPHSFYADPDPTVFSECGSGSGSRSKSSLTKFEEKNHEEFS